MSRFFAEARTAVESHGGTISKFAGDAVLGVFGMPVAREDDAWRAVCAAVSIRRRMESLNRRLDADHGLRLRTRTGVNTGEIVAGQGASVAGMLVGDPVNVAARLEQGAGEDEILLGDETHRLVRAAVVTGSPRELEARGKAEPVTAFPVLDVRRAERPQPRRLDAPMVGRETERDQLGAEFERALRTRTGRSVTVVGAAGLGKSRLAADLARRVAASATVLEGRCPSFGEANTFWPLRQVVEAAAPLAPAGDGVKGLFGAATGGTAPQERFPDVRRFFEAVAAQRPALIVLEDLHWAEPLFLDLIEYLERRPPRAPILLLGLGRPELTCLRPEWPADTIVELEPLTDAACTELVGNQLGTFPLDEAARRRILAAAEGHPLFLEELIALLVERGHLRCEGDRWKLTGDPAAFEMPMSIRGLLSSRLDPLPDDERALLEAASVVGKDFSAAAVEHAWGRSAIEPLLERLVERALITPDDGGYRFRHVLIRDAAYASVVKDRRARMHQRLAEWLERSHDARVSDELIGHHFEQAFRCREDLGTVREPERRLATRAARHLVAAGRRGHGGGDWPAAADLLGRAADLLEPGDPERVEMLPVLGFARADVGDYEQALANWDEAIERGGQAVAGQARIASIGTRLLVDPEAQDHEQALSEIEAIAEQLATIGDDTGVARACLVEADVANMVGLYARMQEALERALSHAEAAGDRRLVVESLAWLPGCLWWGPVHAAPGITRCTEMLERARGESKVEVFTLCCRAALQAMRGHFDESRASLDEAAFLDGEPGLEMIWTGKLSASAALARLSGDLPQAEADLRLQHRVQSEVGARAFAATGAAELARVLYEQGRYDEADEATDIAAADASQYDLSVTMPVLGVRAMLTARGGDLAEAERHARDAIAAGSASDATPLQAQACMDLAEVLRLGGRVTEAEASARVAQSLFRSKGDVVSAGWAESFRAELRARNAQEDLETRGAQT